MIRNQSELIPSFYACTAPELGNSMKYNSDKIIKYLSGNKTNNYLDTNVKYSNNGYSYLPRTIMHLH